MGGKTSSASKAKYNAKAYDQVVFTVKKGDREKIKAHAASKGLSMAEYLKKLIEADMGGLE